MRGSLCSLIRLNAGRRRGLMRGPAHLGPGMQPPATLRRSIALHGSLAFLANPNVAYLLLVIATAIAEYFRDQGLRVNLMMDSVTRFAMAQREIGLAVGEPPASRGYTPSVFSLLPKLLERSGTSPAGSITGFYSVLVEGDDLDEPISDAVRGILDGHIVLSRALAQRSHYPAVDVLQSVSRLAEKVTGPVTRQAAARLRRLLAAYREAEDLINVGAYVEGTSADIDEAVKKMPEINAFLIQAIEERFTMEDAFRRMGEIAGLEIPDEELAGEAVSLPARAAS